MQRRLPLHFFAVVAVAFFSVFVGKAAALTTVNVHTTRSSGSNIRRFVTVTVRKVTPSPAARRPLPAIVRPTIVFPTRAPLPTYIRRITPTPASAQKPTIIPLPATATQTPVPVSPTPIKVIPTATATPSPIPTSSDTDSVKTYIMNAVNDYRRSMNLPAVQTSQETCSFAKVRAEEISSGFNHSGFDTRIQNKSLPYKSWSYVTENLAMTPNYQNVVKMWIESAGHAENMRKDTPFVCVERYGNYYAYEGMKP